MNRLMHRRLMFAAVGLVLALGAAGYLAATRSAASTLKNFGDAPAFVLTDHLDRPVRSAELRGQVVVANFVYTSCRDICPFLTVQMRQLQDRLRQERLLGRDVQLLSFTVDPARDTPTVLRSYAERHQADPAGWRFVTGPADTLVPLIVDGFRLGVDALPPATAGPDAGDHGLHADHGYEVMHSGRFVLIDRRGRIRAYYDGRDVTPERVVGDIRALLR